MALDTFPKIEIMVLLVLLVFLGLSGDLVLMHYAYHADGERDPDGTKTDQTRPDQANTDQHRTGRTNQLGKDTSPRPRYGTIPVSISRL
ncbi:hypothetical protein CLCR_03743 [Cladophialophora carrionii]|uniref:Uncharacterized protein n=1 Tax=Cladophialophora carrionii TaxID=86049 RepID=A0A1C1CHC5_9EURO|nr:hypothetical protein CLCR_03743 [Cladophialophora carrionii]